jgi:hypothetical protein
MRVQVQVLEPGTKVTVTSHPEPGWEGVWIVHCRLVEHGLQDALYDLFHANHGLHAQVRRSGLRIVKEVTDG